MWALLAAALCPGPRLYIKVDAGAGEDEARVLRPCCATICAKQARDKTHEEDTRRHSQRASALMPNLARRRRLAKKGVCAWNCGCWRIPAGSAMLCMSIF